MRGGFCAALVVAGLLGGVAKAIGTPPLTVDGDWVMFKWKNAPQTWTINGPFAFHAPTWISLKVTDVGYDGDRFEVYDGGQLIGATSMPADDGAFARTIDIAYTDARWSSGEFSLPPGPHAIDIRTIAAPAGFTYGNGYLRADTALVVPDPQTTEPYANPAPGAVLLGGLGATLVGWLHRRRFM